jgi:hypothetical protein
MLCLAGTIAMPSLNRVYFFESAYALPNNTGIMCFPQSESASVAVFSNFEPCSSVVLDHQECGKRLAESDARRALENLE